MGQRGSIPGKMAFWLLVGLDLLATGVYILLMLRNGVGAMTLDWSTAASAALPLSAAVILRRLPGNPVGWVMAVMGLGMLLIPITGEYAYYTMITRPGSLPLGDVSSWVYSWGWTLWEPLPILGTLIFPTGKPPSPRWWWPVRAFIAGDLLVTGVSMAMLWPLRGVALITGEATAGFGPNQSPLYVSLNMIWVGVFVIFLVAAALSMAVRFRRSQGVERQQLKWIFLALVVVPLDISMSYFVTQQSPTWLQAVFAVMNVAAIVGFPVAVMFAITRYHLYDIDVIIRRTLLYAPLTLTLGLLYFASVVLFETVLTHLGGQRSAIVIVLSTLLIAALFSPLRRRFQTLIDQRFYRQRYNQEQILDHFAADLRSEADLESIHQRLLSVVDENLKPETLAFWLVSRPKK